MARVLDSQPALQGVPLRVAADAMTGRAYTARAIHLARARLGPFVAFALVFQAFSLMRLASVVGFASPLGSEAVLSATVSNAITFVVMFAAIVFTEALGLPRWRHMLASFAALTLGLLVSLGAVLLLYGGSSMTLVRAGVIASGTGLRDLWLYIGAGMLLVAYFAFRERELAALKAAQDANTQRATVERATIAARLKVMQARVEPELLFDALSDVRDLYLRDRDAAEALLDDLIAYLRAALPQIRGDSSTLGREAALAVAYAKVLPAARRGELEAMSAVGDHAQELPFPPMVLLPLVRAAAQSRLSRITIESDGASGSCATVRIEPAHRCAGWDDAGLESVRAALVHGFGADATLEVENGRAIVRWRASASV